MHLVAADARTVITFALSPGQASDAVEGRELLGGIKLPAPLHLVMDRACAGQQNPPTGPGIWLPPGGPAQKQSPPALAVR